MIEQLASDEVTDAIAHIEMQRQTRVPEVGLAAACQSAMSSLLALHEQEVTAGREGTAGPDHEANMAAIAAAIERLRERQRGGGRQRPGGPRPSHERTPGHPGGRGRPEHGPGQRRPQAQVPARDPGESPRHGEPGGAQPNDQTARPKGRNRRRRGSGRRGGDPA